MIKQALAAALAVAGVTTGAFAAPAPDGHEAMLVQLIRDTAAGALRYETLTPELAAAVRPQADAVRSDLAALGAMKSVTFTHTNASGQEIYRTVFEKGALDWAFSVDGQGRISNAVWRPVAADPS